MKLMFIKDSDVVHEVSMTDIEPFTYMEYKDIPTLLYTSSLSVNRVCPDFLGKKGILFALIFTEETINAYYAPNICNLRYSIQGNMVLRYKLLDPINRLVCTKIEYYIADDPLYIDNNARENVEIYKHDDESFDNRIKDDSICSEFYCDEMEFLRMGGVENFLDEELRNNDDLFDEDEYSTLGHIFFYLGVIVMLMSMALFI